MSGDCPCSLCYTMSTLRCTCILWISKLDFYYLCQVITGYSRLKDFWSNDLPPLSEGSLNGPLLWVLWWIARNEDVCTTLNYHSNVYRWLQTAHNLGLANFVPRKQLCKHFFNWSHPMCLYQLLKIKSSQNTSNLLSICKLATSFELRSHHQATLNHINVGILSGSTHVYCHLIYLR